MIFDLHNIYFASCKSVQAAHAQCIHIYIRFNYTRIPRVIYARISHGVFKEFFTFPDPLSFMRVK